MMLLLMLDWLALFITLWLWSFSSEACGVTGTC